MIKIYRKYSKIFVVIYLLTLICLFPVVNVNAENRDKPKNVLIINSYHQGFTWSKEQDDGIIDKLKQSDKDLTIFIEYMDWKNYPTDQNLRFLYDYFKYKYQNLHIDVLITTDDAALEFVLGIREELFLNAPVVFCGVNQSGFKKITKDYSNVTGILEEIDPTDTVKMALNINPSIKNIYILYDNTESGASSGKIIIEKIKSMGLGLNTVSLNDLAYDYLLKIISNLDKDSIILASTYYSDVNGKIVDFENAVKEISKNSNVPVYHLYDLGLNNGGIGGVMMSGKLQGEHAADLALRILGGENPNSIPVESPKTTRKIFDYKQLERFGISLRTIPKDSEIINKPFSFYETYKTIVLSVVAAIAVLITFVLVLLIYVNKLRQAEKKLSENHEELTQIYEELAASDEELQNQFEEVLKINTKLKVSEEKLAFLAFHDALTGLSNKLSLYENDDKKTILSCDKKTALLFIDIDNFKYVNDSMGHAFGDQLIIKVSQRLTSLLKEGCSIYRLSGDEFVILVPDIYESGDAEIFAAHILAGIKGQFSVLESIIHISLSIGIAIYPDHGGNIEELIKNADIAMYKAKNAGRNGYIVYDETMNIAFQERADIERYLRKALTENEFEIYYQPQYDLEKNKISGFEALLRWHSPELGFVSPSKFIKVAEDAHIIIQLGAWVMGTACAFLKKLHNIGHTDLCVSVNVSVLQLMQTDFHNLVLDTLDLYRLDPSCLELEITESKLIESYDTIAGILERLGKAGVGIALDDFGRGYSSLSYLMQLPISTLKIDKSFIDNISNTNSCEVLTAQIIALGKNMGMSIVAEGVEKNEQVEFLSSHGCNKVQGYIYSRPVPEQDILEMLDGSAKHTKC